MPPEFSTHSAAPQVLSALGSLTGVPVVQAIAGTAAVILEAANVRVLKAEHVSGAERYVRLCRERGSIGPNVFASPSW